MADAAGAACSGASFSTLGDAECALSPGHASGGSAVHPSSADGGGITLVEQRIIGLRRPGVGDAACDEPDALLQVVSGRELAP
eukprot:365162-Chlamydomonas_euryale.AAC.7